MTTQQIKARREYMTVQRCDVPSERVRVTGFVDVEVGYPKTRLERWCRVRLSDGGVVLMHPTELEEITDGR